MRHALSFLRSTLKLSLDDALDGIIEFIFGALRLLLVIYMAIALIQIVNAARQGEEWKDLMRTPLLVILVVVIGDFIAGVIFGAA